MDNERRQFHYRFKCRLCGKLHESVYFEGKRVDAIERICTILRDGSYTLGITVRTTDVHFCDDGNLGISDLQGIHVITP